MFSRQNERTEGAIKKKLSSQSAAVLRKSPHIKALRELCEGGPLRPRDGAKERYRGHPTQPGQQQMPVPGALP